MRRSRSGRHVRTTTLADLAVARQSMERTSSPRTYSRSESNSVPAPLIRKAARPSSSRNRATRLGRWRIEGKAGHTRMRPVHSLLAWRPARPRGPRVRTVTRSVRSMPRRMGTSVVATWWLVEAGRSRGCRFPRAPAEGCQASRNHPRTRRLPVFEISNEVGSTVSGRVRVPPERCNCNCEGLGANHQSITIATMQSATQPAVVLMAGRSSTAPMPSTTSIGARQVRNTRATLAPAQKPAQ